MSLYLDYNAHAPMLEGVRKVYLDAIARLDANASSPHAMGESANTELERARATIARQVGADPIEIVFTSGASESIVTAIQSALRDSKKRMPERVHLITFASEHSVALNACQNARALGFDLSVLPVLPSGLPDMHAFRKALSDYTAMVSLMWVNNETGVIAPLAEIVELASEAGALVHVDGVQALGKLDAIDLHSMPGITYASFSAHKACGPQGIGALYLRRGTHYTPLIGGGHQERGRRAGTENVAASVGFAAALEWIASNPRLRDNAQALRDQLEARMVSELGCRMLGAEAPRVFNTTCALIPGANAADLTRALSERGIYVSTGAACMSGQPSPSHVVRAMGVEEDEARGALRISWGWEHESEDVERVMAALKECVR